LLSLAEVQNMMQQGHLPFRSMVHFSMSRCRSTFSILTHRSAWHAPVRIFSNVSEFLHSVSWPHSLQSDTFSFKAQALISQFGLPSPFRHPRHRGMACIDASPLAKSRKSKSFAAQSSNPYIWLICAYLLVSSLRTPLPTAQLPH